MPRGWYPINIMSDFEHGAIAATKHVFPNATNTGCLFHFGQCIYRRIQRLPMLLQNYNENDELRMNLRSLQALAFVQPNYVYNYFCILMSTIEPTPEVQELIMYFINTWIGPRRIIEVEGILGEGEGREADQWIRGRINALNLRRMEALFPIDLWNVVARVAAGIGRTNNSVEVKCQPYSILVTFLNDYT